MADYQVAADGALVSVGDMDSTDAYAGTFLLAVRRWWKASGDVARLRSLAAGVAGAVRAIEATQDGDGLTWAKPSWHVKYLMDQAEAYAGLRAAAEVAAALGDAGVGLRATAAATRMSAGVGRLWNAEAAAYDWAVHGNGARSVTNWSVLYPDAQQQAWAVAFGLVTSSRAKALVSTFDAAQPLWDQPAAMGLFASGTEAVGYWPVTGWAHAAVGDTARSLAAATGIRAAALATSRAWPFTSGTAGQLIGLESSDPAILVR